MNKERLASMANRIKDHNTGEIQAAQIKANRQLQNQISHFSNKIAAKFETADINKVQFDRSIEKKQEEKEKIYSEKLRQLQNNIQNL